jgi:hypothetical protein
MFAWNCVALYSLQAHEDDLSAHVFSVEVGSARLVVRIRVAFVRPAC